MDMLLDENIRLSVWVYTFFKRIWVYILNYVGPNF